VAWNLLHPGPTQEFRMHTPETHMYPAGLALHPNEDNDERNLQRRARATVPERPLSDRLRSPYLVPVLHLSHERDRLPFRRGLP
jgi:hypothetical protein